MGEGAVYYGGARCGKTYRLCQKALAADDPIMLSFTNKAIQNVKSALCDVYNNYELAKKCYTFDLFFFDHHGRDITALEGKTIFVDEYSMTPNKWMTKLYQAFTKYRLTIYMFGDTNQCDPVEPVYRRICSIRPTNTGSVNQVSQELYYQTPISTTKR